MRLRRLRRPKYLAGAIVGGLYFYFYFFRWLLPGPRGATGMATVGSPDTLALFESVGAVVLFVMVLMSWILPKDRAALAFSEAEVAFLFPAPVSRRTLIHYKLLRSQLAILVTTLFLTLISGRFVAGNHAWIRIAGWWLVLSTLNLHFLGSSFARTLLLEQGIANWQRRTAVLLLFASLVGAALLWGRNTMRAPRLEDLESIRAMVAWLKQLFAAGPMPYVLYPFRIMVHPYTAPDARAFAQALWPVLCLLGLHYWWVIRANVAFEEASVALSRRVADRLAAARAGRWQSGPRTAKPKRAPFELRPMGWAPTALLWKNLIAAGQFFTLRFWLVMVWILACAALFLAVTSVGSGFLIAVSLFCLMITGMSLLLGPQMVRQDFRQDLPMADILKMYPVSGWQVALGELMAPAAILTAVQWTLLIVTVVLCSRLSSETVIPLTTRLAVGAGAAILAPLLNLISLVIPNLAVLLFPTWFQTGRESPQGIEATGQRLIFMLGQLVVFVVALIPAALAFLAVFFLLRHLIGWVGAVPPASLAAALVLGLEAALGMMLLGGLFERLDLSAESTN